MTASVGLALPPGRAASEPPEARGSRWRREPPGLGGSENRQG